MATIKFPNPNLKRVPNRNVTFDDWSAGMVTSVDGDIRDPRTSGLIKGFTNRYKGKLVMTGGKSEYAIDAVAQEIDDATKWEFVYLDDTEYILAVIDDGTTVELKITDTSGSPWVWTQLEELISSGDYATVTLDYIDWTVATSRGVPVIYVTYERSDGDGDTLKVSYKSTIDMIPYVKWEIADDNASSPILFTKSDDTSVPASGDDATYGEYLVASPEVETGYWETNSDVFGFGGTGSGVPTQQAQRFLVGRTTELDSVMVRLKTVGTISSGYVYAYIYDDNGGGEPDNLMATSDAVPYTAISGSLADVVFEFSGSERIDLNAVDDPYWLVLGAETASDANYYQAEGQDDGGTLIFPDGKRAEKDASSWTVDANDDLTFRVIVYSNTWGEGSGVEGVNDVISDGDILLIGERGEETTEYWKFGTWVDYIAIAEVVAVTATSITLNRAIYPGEDITFWQGKNLHVAIASLDWLDSEYDTPGWHCRSIEQDPPDGASIFREDQSYGIIDFGMTSTDLLGNALVSGYQGNESIQYGVSYGLEGGQVTDLVTVSHEINGIQSSDYNYVRFKVALYPYVWSSDRIFPSNSIDEEVSGALLWRKKADEEEFGFLDRIPRTDKASINDIRDIMADGVSFMIDEMDSTHTMRFVNVITTTKSDGSDNIYTAMGFTGYYYDRGEVLAETFRTVTGVEREDASNAVYGRSIASLGERIFIGNARFPHNNDRYEEYHMDDEVVYSVPDCGCMFALDNTLGYRTGGKDSIVSLLVSGTNLFIFKKNACSIVSIAGANEFSWSPRGEFPVGLIHQDKKCVTPHGPVWFSRDGLYMISENVPVNIARTVLVEYFAGIDDLDECCIGYEPKYDRVYVCLDDNAYWCGFSSIEGGWKESQDVYPRVSTNEDGQLVAINEEETPDHKIYLIEGATPINRTADYPAWESGELTLGPIGEEVKLKRAYVWYRFYREHASGDDPLVTFTWYVDGEEQDSEDLYVGTGSTDANAWTEHLQRINLNGRGRRVEFKIDMSGFQTYNWIKGFDLTNVEVVFKTTRLK